MAVDWTPVLREHILAACQLYDDGSERPRRMARNTFLLVENRRYPAKHIRGLAYQLATGDRLNPDGDYSGGQETKRHLNELGFDVEYKGVVHIGDNGLKKGSLGQADEQKRPRLITTGSTQRDPQKEALRRVLEDAFGLVETEARFDWLVVPDSTSMDRSLVKILDALTSYRSHAGFYRPGEPLRVDYFVPSQGLILEYDERQHFTIPRAIALSNYPSGIALRFDTRLWIRTCGEIRATDCSPCYRDEQRAFYDALRDIQATRNGMKVMRLKAGDVDWTAPDARLKLDKLMAQDSELLAQPSTGQSSAPYQMTRRGGSVITVALVVPKVWAPRKGKRTPVRLPGIADRYQPLIPAAHQFAAESIDLVVFPEAYIRHEDSARLASLVSLAQQLKACLLVGASQEHDSRSADWQTLILIEPDGSWSTIYRKHATAGAVAFELPHWNPERQLPVFTISGIKVGCTICHDSYLGLLQRYLARQGAQIWINPSYDNVIHEKWESIHRLRAVENGVVSLCTLHDNRARINRRRIRPFGFGPDGGELQAHPPGRPSEIKPLSSCTEPGIYIAEVPLSDRSARQNPRLLPDTRKTSFRRKSHAGLVRISLTNGRPHVWAGHGWQALGQATPTQISGNTIALGLVHEKGLFDAGAFASLLAQIHQRYAKCRPLLWNLWDRLPARPEQLVDLLLGRALESFSCLVLSDKTTIYEVIEIAGGTKTMRRISVNYSECELDLEYSLGLGHAFRITVDSLDGVAHQQSLFPGFLSRYLSL